MIDEKEKEEKEIKKECENVYKHDWLGYLAAVLGPLSLITEIYEVHKIKKADQISYLWLILYLSVIILWFAHSIINKVKPGLVSGSIGIFLMIIFIYLKIKYSKK